MKYNTNFNSKKSSIEKKINLTENSHWQNKSNYLDSKIKTNRNEPSKIKNENLIFSADNLYNNSFNINNFRCKLSRNIIISKNDIKMLNNLLSDRKEINNSPNSNNIFYFNSNYKNNTRNKNNNMNNIINIDLNIDKNIYNNQNKSIKNLSQFVPNKNEENSFKETNENNINANNNYFKNENKKNMISKNNNENSFAILKNINHNIHLNNNPVKLYISKEESKNNKES